MHLIEKVAALGLASFALSACSGASAKVERPEGETDLSCAAMIYAATNLADTSSLKIGEGLTMSDYVNAMTRYGTAHAEANGLDAQEVLGVIKVNAYRMTGKIGNADVVMSDSGVVKRARACMGLTEEAPQ